MRSHRNVSAAITDRRTEAWALTVGVRLPLACTGDDSARIRRGSPPDVMPDPQPRRSRVPAWIGWMRGRLFGAAPSAPDGANVARMPARQAAKAAVDDPREATPADTTNLAA
ncbi:MAG: hypothetical protein JNL61_08845 [Rhizobiaceae bacterium]|nr:hypothetical protein [Rhizobiaceae bacterium]